MVSVRINGNEHEAPDAGRNLLSFIRFDAELTGTKYGCGEGVCGACTVLVDGQPLRACTTTVGAVPAARSRQSRALRRTASCTPCSRRSSMSPRCNVDTAFPASS